MEPDSGSSRSARGEIFDRDPDLLGRRVYLVQPGEWLIPQKLWYTLSAAIDGILWTAFAYSEFATLSPLARVVVCSIFILPYAHLTAVTM